MYYNLSFSFIWQGFGQSQKAKAYFERKKLSISLINCDNDVQKNKYRHDKIFQVTPDQVRWKINALTKKYKDCVDNGQETIAFKYFNEMHQILGRYNEDSGTYRLASGVIQNQEIDKDNSANRKIPYKNSTPFRKLRAERRAKVELDKQWIDYIKRQEEQKQVRDERYERSLRLREEELQLKKKELEIKQSIALRKLQLKEKRQEEILKIEREKCALLRKLLNEQ